MAFCDFVRKLREQNNLTQVQLADYLEVNVNTIKQIEANKIKTPSNRVLDKFCEYLKEDRITVINKIIFNKTYCENEYLNEQSDVLSLYMSYLYLQGWNVDIAPAIYHTRDIGELAYAGQLTKKREPNNKIVIASIGAEYDENVDYISNDQAVYYITSSMAAFFCIDEIKLKGIHIVFDAKMESHVNLFNIFKNLSLNKIPFNYQMILFDSIDGKVVDNIELRSK